MSGTSICSLICVEWFCFDSLTLLFWFDLFLEARPEILTKISSVFLVNLKTPNKGYFEINWPLMLYLHLLSIWYWMAVDLHESGIQSRHHLLLWCWMHLNFGPSVAQASVHLWEVIKRNTMLYIINRIPHKFWSLHLLLCRS